MIDAENMDMYLMLHHWRHIFINRTMGGDYLKAWKDINEVRENNPQWTMDAAEDFYASDPETYQTKDTGGMRFLTATSGSQMR